ncbi:MAG: hypothetical protein AAGD96_01475 [Chloroflexota bacterium]
MSNNNGTGFKDIPSSYLNTVNQYLTQTFTDQEARTDEDEYLILVDLIERTERGELIIDESGNANNQLLEMGWNDERVTADLALNKTRTINIKDYLLIGGIGLLVIGILLYMFGFFDPSPSEEVVEQPVEQVEEAEEVVEQIIVTPLSQQSLQIASSLGGSIKIAEPRTLDVEGKSLNKTMAIVPARTNPNGSIGFLPAENRGSAVVWVQGTVINYVIGAGPEFINALQPDDVIKLRTNTGQVLSFVVTEVYDTQPQRTELFSQRQSPGLTLFELPADDGLVRIARAIYQSSNETFETTAIRGRIGETVESHPDIDVQVSWVTVNQLPNRLVQIDAKGIYVGQKDGNNADLPIPILAFLGDNETQFTPTNGGEISKTGNWFATWEIPEDRLADVQLFLKPITSQQPIEFDLSQLTHPHQGLSSYVSESHWDMGAAEGVFTIEITNNGDGTAYLMTDEVNLRALDPNARLQPSYQTSATFPLELPPGEVKAISFIYQLPDGAEETTGIQIQLLDELYDIQFPAVVLQSES